MKKLLTFLFLVLFSLLVVGCGGNDVVKTVKPQSEKIEYLLISFGFNVNEEQFSKETQEIATSLKKEYKKEFRREEIINQILEELEKNVML